MQHKWFEGSGKSEIISISGSTTDAVSAGDENAQLRKQLEQMGASLSTLKAKYEELYKEYVTVADK